MRRVDFATMFESPVGCIAREATFLAWAWSPALAGIIYFERIGDEHLPMLEAHASLPFHRDFARPYHAVIDASRLRYIGPGVFELIGRHTDDVRALGAFARLAVILPPGLVGAASIGIAFQHPDPALEMAYPSDLPGALAYLGADADTARAIGEEVAAALVHEPVDDVRALLAREPGLALDEVARRLGTSTRALQRLLQAANTSFRAETAEGRYAHALHALVTTDHKIEAIARAAGYASAIGFTRRVRAQHGVTPSELREARRRGT